MYYTLLSNPGNILEIKATQLCWSLCLQMTPVHNQETLGLYWLLEQDSYILNALWICFSYVGHYSRTEFKIWCCGIVNHTQETRMPKENRVYYSRALEGKLQHISQAMGGTPSFGQEAEARMKGEPGLWPLFGVSMGKIRRAGWIAGWATLNSFGRLDTLGCFLIAQYLALGPLIKAKEYCPPPPGEWAR